MIISKLKELLSKLKKYKLQTMLVLDYEKRNSGKIFHSVTKIIASDWAIEKSFIARLQSIMTKIKIMLVNIGLSWL